MHRWTLALVLLCLLAGCLSPFAPQANVPSPASLPASAQIPLSQGDPLSDPDAVISAFADALLAQDTAALGELTDREIYGWKTERFFSMDYWKETLISDASWERVDDGGSYIQYRLTLTVDNPGTTRLAAGTADYRVTLGSAYGDDRLAVFYLIPEEEYLPIDSFSDDQAVQMIQQMRSFVTQQPFTSPWQLDADHLVELCMVFLNETEAYSYQRSEFTSSEISDALFRCFGIEGLAFDGIASYDSETDRFSLLGHGGYSTNERVVSVDEDLNGVKTVVVECYADLLHMVPESRVTYVMYPNGRGGYRFGWAAERRILHLPDKLPVLDTVPLSDGGEYLRDPRSPAELINTFLQALSIRDADALAILGGNDPLPDGTALPSLDQISISDYYYAQLPGYHDGQVLFELTIAARTTGGTVLKEGAHRYIASVGSGRGSRSNTPYLYITAVAPEENWFSSEVLSQLTSVWGPAFLSQFAGAGSFASWEELPPDVLLEVLVELARAELLAQESPHDVVPAQMVSDAALRYFRITEPDLPSLYEQAAAAGSVIGYDPQQQLFTPVSRAIVPKNERIAAIGPLPDGRVRVTLERYRDAFQLEPYERLIYTMLPNADGSYAVASALPPEAIADEEPAIEPEQPLPPVEGEAPIEAEEPEGGAADEPETDPASEPADGSTDDPDSGADIESGTEPDDLPEE